MHPEVPLIGLDLNATRMLAVGGNADHSQLLLLEGNDTELPMALNLEGKRVEVGKSGLHILRRLPHMVCHDFLASLGRTRQWVGGRHRVDASQALTHVLQYLQPIWQRTPAVGLAVPTYLEAQQVQQLFSVAKPLRLPLTTVVQSALPLGVVSYAQIPWHGPALVLEVDDHALTWTAIAAEHGELRNLGVHVLPHLRLTSWKERLLDSVSEHCIRQNRRDPRAFPDVEQTLFEQLGRVLTTTQEGQILELVIQRDQWYHNLLLRFEEVARVCRPMVVQTLQAMNELAQSLQPQSGTAAIIVSWQAAQLPGLISALEQSWDQGLGARVRDPHADMDEEPEQFYPGVCVLPAEATAYAVHALTVSRKQLQQSPAFVDAVPLPVPHRVDVGQPRLSFRGRDYPIQGGVFSLGRHSGCNIVFDNGLFPTVSGRHCEIVYQQWLYILRDTSKNGTLVNNRPVIKELALQPGDWIQLGQFGPRLRFLGHVAGKPKLVTTA